MDSLALLKKVFPFSFGVKDVADLVVKIIIYVVAAVLVTLVCWVIGIIPFIGGILAWLIGTVADLYLLGGAVIALLVFLKVIKE